MIFVITFLQRILSGYQSYFGYSKKSIGLILLSVVLSILPLLNYHDSYWFYGFLVINAIVIFMKAISFNILNFKSLDKFKDIHLWENFVTGFYFAFIVFQLFSWKNLILACCSVYPALIIHKGLINTGNNLNFFDSATDDVSGKTYGILLLGIKIKRSSTTFRMVASIASIILAIIILFH